MTYQRPDPSKVPAIVAAELARTTTEEWHALIDGIVGALDSHRKRSFILGRVVDAGWSTEFADFAIQWAEDEIAIWDAEAESGETRGKAPAPINPDSVPDLWKVFVQRLETERVATPSASERLLDADFAQRTWKPWEVRVLDTEFRGRLASALNSSTLDTLTARLGEALELLSHAGITEGESRTLQVSYSPVMDERGSIIWHHGQVPQGSITGTDQWQFRQNRLALGRFLEWYADHRAQDWLRGVRLSGPIDLASLTSIRLRAEQNLILGNSNVRVLDEFKSALEPHAQVVSVLWLSKKLPIKYQGFAPSVTNHRMSLVMELGEMAIGVVIITVFCALFLQMPFIGVVFALGFLVSGGFQLKKNAKFTKFSNYQIWS